MLVEIEAVGRGEGLAEGGGEVLEGGFGFAFNDGHLGEEAVADGVLGGNGFSFGRGWAAGFGSVEAGGLNLGLGTGFGIGIHRAMIVVRWGVENELWENPEPAE